ncbi:MAG: preprotein translocase subunit SecA [Alphaproteobacteria bacterium]|nr:preprotein translocase subunit SecA [Alphaproteobacteria bacterium]
MLQTILRSAVGTANQRMLKKMQSMVTAINALESSIEKLDDADFPQKIADLKAQAQDGADLETLLPETFALVREASKRTLGLRHFDEQLLGGIILHRGQIAEMKTGEGKTLVATLPVVLNALTGKGVHLVTVNDYLAKRDAGWMAAIYHFLGLTVGSITSGLDDDIRREQYQCDITYATNNELGFDYLRDNLKLSLAENVQRDYHFAIVDEVDSILIDEARTPLIISGQAEDDPQLYQKISKIIPKLTPECYELDEKQRNITMTEQGSEMSENLLRESGILQEGTLYDMQNISLLHQVDQGLRALHLFQRDVHYVVEEGNIIIIDEFTGRKMPSRRYSDGLHQAIEAREGVKVRNESQTVASVTFQNYFRMYEKLSGMTGTAATEAEEFGEIYSLEVIEVPTHVQVMRDDMDDEIYRTAAERDNAVIAQIQECYQRQQPVLVGTVSIEKSEALSAKLTKAKIKHNVLNARQHEKEAQIISEAGKPAAVTIATNMAGRGTDIQLGGNLDMKIQLMAAENGHPPSDEEVQRLQEATKTDRKIVLESGGLFIIGTERHENRRIDNQLRGRSGRQGDAGASRFFLSLQDDLMRIFGSERMDGMLKKLGVKEGEAISHPWVNKAIERAQKKVETHHFDIRKQLLKFDNVLNDQRHAIFEQRREIMVAEDIGYITDAIIEELIETYVASAMPERSTHQQWQLESLHAEIYRIFGLDLPLEAWAKEDGVANEEMIARITKSVNDLAAARKQRYGENVMQAIEKSFMLQVIDSTWKDHLHQLDHLRQGIGLRAYGQRDPLNEYKQEAFGLFEDMLSRINENFVQIYFRAEFNLGVEKPKPRKVAMGENQTGEVTADNPDSWGRVKRNEVCPCGSGKKYKHCHGKV